MDKYSQECVLDLTITQTQHEAGTKLVAIGLSSPFFASRAYSRPAPTALDCGSTLTRLLMECGDVLVQALAAGKVPRTGSAKKGLDVGVLDRVRN